MTNQPTRNFPIEPRQKSWLPISPTLRGILVVFALLLSTWVGYRYNNEIFIPIFPILLWLFAILIAVAALYPRDSLPLFKVRPNRTWVGIFSLLAIAFFLRTVNLDGLPPGFHVDEMGGAQYSLLHVFNPEFGGLTINPLITDSNSQPVLHSYLLRLSMAIFGMTTVGARLTSVFAGTLAVAAVFLLTDELAGRKTAWVSAILMAVYHYHIHWSRISLNNIWTTLFLPLAVGLFLRGWRKNNGIGALLAGLCLGITAHFYTGGYVLFFLMGFLILQAGLKTREYMRLTLYSGRMLLLAAVVAAPMIVYAIKQPGFFFDRANVVYGWSPEAIAASIEPVSSTWEYFLLQMARSFGAYNFYPDTTGFYGSGIPFLIGLSSVFFPVGIVIAIHRKLYIPLIWLLLITVLGGVMLAMPPGSSHFVPSIPVICLLTALPLGWMLETKRSIWAYIFLAGIILVDLNFYFVVYAASPSLDLSIPFSSINP